jgi:hypothetical protein
MAAGDKGDPLPETLAIPENMPVPEEGAQETRGFHLLATGYS